MLISAEVYEPDLLLFSERRGARTQTEPVNPSLLEDMKELAERAKHPTGEIKGREVSISVVSKASNPLPEWLGIRIGLGFGWRWDHCE